MTEPTAFFDVLSIGRQLTDLVNGGSRSEIHLFAYSSCLLSLYDRRPVADWGYVFQSTNDGIPFAEAIDTAIDDAIALQYLTERSQLLSITDAGREEIELLGTFSEQQLRQRYIVASSDSLLVLTPGNVREAFDYDPALKFLRVKPRADWLLTVPIIDRIYGQFAALREALDYNGQDLTLPLVSWLRYLLASGRGGAHDARPG